MPAHHEIEETIDEYLSKVSIDDKQALFQSVNKAGTALTGRALNRYNAWAAIRKRARNAGFLTPVGCHTWRALFCLKIVFQLELLSARASPQLR
jgi:hypothetical protein